MLWMWRVGRAAGSDRSVRGSCGRTVQWPASLLREHRSPDRAPGTVRTGRTSPVKALAVASPLYRDTAVVLRTYKLGEADRIIVMLSENHGKVRAVAKGVRKTKSKFGARLEPLSHVRLLLYQGRELDIVSQAESVETLAPLMGDLDHLTSGLALVEAVDQITMEREPAPHIYRMLVGALRTVAERSGPLVVAAFYWKLLA